MLVELYGQLLSTLCLDDIPSSQKKKMIANSYDPQFPRAAFFDGNVKIEYDLTPGDFLKGSGVYQDVSDYLKAFELLFDGKDNPGAVETRFLGCKTFMSSYAGTQVAFEIKMKGGDRQGKPFGTTVKLMETIAVREEGSWRVFIKSITHYTGTLDGFTCATESKKPFEKDSDTDGVPDSRDECPNEFGFRTISGCPDDDLDGVPNIYDKCPKIAGPTNNEGCPDNDNDGFPDHLDECPYNAGIPKFNGCPDSDNDGIPDKIDRCPFLTGLPEFKGCPDKDADGVPDIDDSCPFEAGPPEYGGCPEPDSDADGVVDSIDECPLIHGSPRLKGCPDGDNDGVADKNDKCPDQKGPQRYDGCPDGDSDGIPDNEDRCPELKGSIKNAGCPVFLTQGSYPKNAYFALNYQLVNRPWSRYTSLSSSNFGERWDHFSEKTKQDFKFQTLENFGLAFYAPVGGYFFGYRKTGPMPDFLEYTLGELNAKYDELIGRGWVVDKPEFYDYGFSGRVFHAGLVVGPFFQIKYLRHLHITGGLTFISGSTWEEYRTDYFGLLPPSYPVDIYAVNIREFNSETHPEIGLALVFPYGHTEFTYYTYQKSFSWKVGVNLPIRLLIGD